MRSTCREPKSLQGARVIICAAGCFSRPISVPGARTGNVKEERPKSKPPPTPTHTNKQKHTTSPPPHHPPTTHKKSHTHTHTTCPIPSAPGALQPSGGVHGRAQSAGRGGAAEGAALVATGGRGSGRIIWRPKTWSRNEWLKKSEGPQKSGTILRVCFPFC